MKRQHPVAILRYTTKNFWLLLIPVIRGFATPDFNLQTWLNVAFFNIIIISALFLFAFIRWRFVKYEFRDEKFVFNGGALLKINYEIPYSIISAVSTKRIFWMRPAKAVSVYIDSESRAALNRRNDADVYIIIHSSELPQIFGVILQKNQSVKMTYKSSKWNLFIFSILFSSTLSGLVFIGTFFIQGSKVLGEQLESRFLTAITDVTEIAGKVISGVTPFAVGILALIFMGWLYSFITNLLRHLNFNIMRTGRNITIENGFFTRWKYYINTEKINYADIRQNLLMKVFSVMSVHVSCSGYGKAKNEIPVFVPVTTKKRVIGSMQMLLPKFRLKDVSIKPQFKFLLRFIGPPVFLILAVIASSFVSVWIFPEWYDVIIFAFIMFEIPSVYLLIVKIIAFLTSGTNCCDDIITLKYCNFYQFHQIIVPKHRIALINVRQNIFQRMNKSCDLIIYTNAESPKKHRVKGLALNEVSFFLGETGIRLTEDEVITKKRKAVNGRKSPLKAH